MIFRKFLIPTESAIFRFITPENSKEVVVTFESAHSEINRKDILRQGFGEKFLLDNGYAVLAVLPNKTNWYRANDIINFLASSEVRHHLNDFDKIHTYGSSMGAYAACTFADVLNAKNVVVIAVITTLAPELVPWEKRFSHGSTMDWSGAFADAVDGVKRVDSVYVVYDNSCLDAKHVNRLEKLLAHRLKKVVTKTGGHGVAIKLSAAKILKPIIIDCLREKPIASVNKHLTGIDLESININKIAPAGARFKLLEG